MPTKLTLFLSNLLLSLLLTLWVNMPIVMAAPAYQRPPTEPGPRPPGGAGSAGDDFSGGKNGSDAGSIALSAIYGTVTDLSRGQFGAGITLSISGAIVRTDGAGRYSITGQHAGEYMVTLQLPGEFQPAQQPVVVYLDGQNSVIVDLAYYSRQSPPMTLPGSASSPSTALPETGAAPSAAWLLLLIAGVCLTMTGWLLHE